MSETKHTPGPWEVRRKGNKIYVATGICIIADGVWGTIEAPEDNPEKRDRNFAEREANANLMAAAPELYAGLTAALTAVETYIDEHDGSDPFNFTCGRCNGALPIEHSWGCKARAAILKAGVSSGGVPPAPEEGM